MLELTLISVRKDGNGNTIEERKRILCENILNSGRYIYLSYKGETSRIDTLNFDYFTIREMKE